MKTNFFLALSAITVLAAVGCKKDTTDPPATTPAATAVDATIGMHFTFKADTAAFTLGTTELQDSLGHHVKLDQVRFFVSGIHAISNDNSVVGHYEGTNLLVDAAHADSIYHIGTVHASSIQLFHFDLGLDASTNGGNPASAAPPLNDASMYFTGMNMGYKFLVVTGHADLDGDNNFETSVSYACGMDPLLTEAHAHVHHALVQGEVFNAALVVDMALIFQGINLIADHSPMMDAPASRRMMTNLALAIDGIE